MHCKDCTVKSATRLITPLFNRKVQFGHGLSLWDGVICLLTFLWQLLMSLRLLVALTTPYQMLQSLSHCPTIKGWKTNVEQKNLLPGYLVYNFNSNISMIFFQSILLLFL